MSSRSSSASASVEATCRAATAKQLIPHVRALAESLQSASKLRLRREVNLVRREMARGQAPGEPHLLVAGLALAAEALRRTVNVTLYDVQLLAAIAMSRPLHRANADR